MIDRRIVDTAAQRRRAADHRSPRQLPYPRLIAVLFVFGGLVAIYIQNVIVPLDQPFWGLFDNQLDLGVYRDGARVVLHGHSLYSAKLLGVMDYTYTPISVVAFIPFALMSFTTAQVVWSLGIFVGLYLTIVLSFNSLGYQTTVPIRIVAGGLVLISALLEPVRSTIWFGQVNVFLMLLVVWDLSRGKASRTRGVGVGITAGIKLTPLLFVPYLLLIRDFRAVVVSLVTFVLTILLGFVILPGESWRYWTRALFDSNRVGAPNTLGNQSLRGAIANLGHTAHPSVALWISLSIIVLATAFWAAAWAHRRDRKLLGVTIIGLASAVVSPMSWGHHWVWIVPLLVIGIDRVIRARTAVMKIVMVAVISLVFLTMFAWPTYLGYPTLFVQWWVPDSYLTGTFFLSGPGWLDWFVYDPYNWVFVVTVIATLLALWWTGSWRGARVSADSD